MDTAAILPERSSDDRNRSSDEKSLQLGIDEHACFRMTVHGHAERAPAFALPPAVLAAIEGRAAAADAGQESLAADLADLAACGTLVAPLPRRLGGSGLGTEPHATIACLDLLRMLGRKNLSVARLVEGHVNAVKLVALYGDEARLARCAADVRGGALLGVWGADAEPPVTLVRSGDTVVLAGRKRFASGLGLVREALVVAGTPAGAQLVLVPATDPARADAAAWRQSGMRATASGTYDVSGLALACENLVGAPGDYLREPFFEGGVWRYCAAHLGGAEALYAAMRDFLVAAGRAGDPHQARRIAEAAIACEGARLWIAAAAVRVEDGGGDGNGAAGYALLAREATEAASIAVLALVERAMGTAAFDEARPVERMRRDLSLFLRQAAPDAKLARAAATLVAAAALPEAL